MSSSMKATLAMLLGALIGLSVIAFSLDRLIPDSARHPADSGSSLAGSAAP